MKNLFTYGTLMFPEVIEELTHKKFYSTKAVLYNHNRYCLKNRVYPGIIKNESSTVEGVLYLGVDETSLKILHQFEGLEYSPKKVIVKAANNLSYQCIAYLMASAYCKDIIYKEWNAELFRKNNFQKYLKKVKKFTRQNHKHN